MKLFEKNDISQGENSNKIEFENGIYHIKIPEELYVFLKATQTVAVNEIEPFIVTRDFFKEIPDDLDNSITSQNWNAIEKELKSNRISFEQLLDRIVYIINERKGLFMASKFNILSLIFTIARDQSYSGKLEKSIKFNVAFKNDLENVLKPNDIEDLVFNFNPEGLVSFSKLLYENNFHGLADHIANAINNINQITKKEIKTIKVFIDEYKKDREYLNKIRGRLSSIIANNPEYYTQIIETSNKNELLGLLIDPKIIPTITDSLVADPDKNSTSIKLNILTDFYRAGIMPDEDLKNFITKILSFIRGNESIDSLQFWLSSLKNLIEIKNQKNIIKIESYQKDISDALNERYGFLQNQYSITKNIECYKTFLDITGKLYIESNKRYGKMDWLIHFFERSTRSDIYMYVNSTFKNIVSSLPAYNWPFAQNIINKFSLIKDWNEKMGIAETINVMLEKTEDGKGLSRPQINKVLGLYKMLLNDKDKVGKVKEYFKRVTKNEIIKEEFKKVLNSSTNINEKITLVGIANEIDPEIAQNMVSDIIQKTTCSNILNILETLKRELGTETFKKEIYDVLCNMKSSEENYKCFLEAIANDGDLVKSSLKENLPALLVEKLTPLLTNDNTNDIVFALKQLDKFKIPDSKKSLIKGLLNTNSMNNLIGEDKKLLEKVKNKLR